MAADCHYDREKVERCLWEAGLGERLEQMPEGLDAYLYKDYEDGVEISGGEAQKIAIARALCKDAPFILLDEPTAALDPISEYAPQKTVSDTPPDETSGYPHRSAESPPCPGHRADTAV